MIKFNFDFLSPITLKEKIYINALHTLDMEHLLAPKYDFYLIRGYYDREHSKISINLSSTQHYDEDIDVIIDNIAYTIRHEYLHYAISTDIHTDGEEYVIESMEAWIDT